MLELDGDLFGRNMECVGAGISGGGPPCTTRNMSTSDLLSVTLEELVIDL